jgi:hypothetical protein
MKIYKEKAGYGINPKNLKYKRIKNEYLCGNTG